jgi:acetoin utilization deacetylase AcuC-like enzyme
MTGDNDREAPEGRRRLPTVWHESYHLPGAATWLSTRKQKEVVDVASSLGLLDLRGDAAFDESATWRDIGTVHDAAYIEAVRTGEPRWLARSSGLAWVPELPAAAARMWSGHIAACRLAMAEGLAFHPGSGAHHARRARGGGFCTFNFLVGAAKALLDAGEASRVLILDLDTHQGNGTWELAGEDERVSVFDVSGDPFGVPEAETDRHVFRLANNPDDYFAVLSKLPALVDSVRPSLIQYQAGMDCHERDLVGGIRGMTAERLMTRDRFVFDVARSRKIPLVFNLAGGYQKGGMTVGLHVGTIQTALGIPPSCLDAGAAR